MPVRIITTHLEFEGQVEETRVVMEGEEPPVWGPDAQLRIVGQPTPRVDGRERVSGRAEYAYDVMLPGMLIARCLRSPHPHARIRALDATRAEALPGVRGVFHHLNAGDLPSPAGRPMFTDEARYAGEEVALVVADSAAIADEALGLIAVDYDVLPFVADAQGGLAPDAPRVAAELETNIVSGTGEDWPKVYDRGNAEQGLAEADVTAELRFETPTQVHNCLETHGGAAAWDGRTLTVWSSTQDIFGARRQIATALKLDLNQVRVIKQYMGGGFGSKFGAGRPGILAAYAAKRLGRPVKCMYDRHEENLATGNRPASAQEYRLGARRDGTLTAIAARVVADVGAHGSWMAPVSLPAKELYQCANVHVEDVPVRTNLGTQAAFRAPGVVEGIAGLEAAMDLLAGKLGMDPLELRRKNVAERYQLLDRPYAVKTLLEAYRIGAEAIGWATRDDPARRFPDGAAGALRVGVGMASQLWGGDGGPPAQALAKLLPDGSAVILTGTQDIGTGTRTVLAQIAAEELGLPLARIRVELGDTEYGLFSPGSGGSMTLASVGPAVRMAAAQVRQELLEVAGQLSEAPADALDVRDGTIIERDTGRERGSVASFLEQLGGHEITGKGMRGPNAEEVTVRTWGAQFAEVEVDTLTGVVRVRRIVAVHDVGRVVNPLTLSSQIEGGIIQGLGLALTEQRIVDPALGIVVNADLEGYKVPTIRDVPEIEITYIGGPKVQANTLGSLGAGEPPIIPTPGAIANAVAHALGRPVTALPLTPRRVLDLLAGE
ncbi:MAG TPA: xanthine dehydrogenase family protein molybdopterin-binding subunit [Ktedonobacterales bacterium]